MRLGGSLLALGSALGASAGLVFCHVYDESLLLPADAGPSGLDGGGGIGWWSGPEATGGCLSAGVPTPTDRPSGKDGADLPPIYMAITGMRLGSLGPDNQPSTTAWQDIGFDLDGVCTQSPTCTTSSPALSCKPTGLSIPVDGNYCRDNTFGRLEITAAGIQEVGGKYGLNDNAFDCALCVGDYNFIIKISGYDGSPDDPQIRVDLYPSPGLASPLPWDCSGTEWRNHPCFTPDMPFTVRDTAVTQPQGGPSLPDAVVADPVAYVRSGYIVAQLPADTFFWFPGYKALATAFPLSFAQALVTGRITRAQDGTWTIQDGTVGGRATEQAIVEGFRLIGFCESDPNFSLMQNFLHANLDILASGKIDPAATCDSVSVGIGFTAGQATPGALVHVPDPVDCAPVGDGGADAPSDARGKDAPTGL